MPTDFKAPAPITVKLNGHKTTKSDLKVGPSFRVSTEYQLSGNVRGALLSEQETFDDDIVGLRTESGVEWFGLGQDLPDLTAQSTSAGTRGSAPATFTLPATVKGNATTRGAIGQLITRIYKIVRDGAGSVTGETLKEEAREWALDRLTDLPVNVAKELLARQAGEELDQHLCPAGGLYRVTSTGNRGTVATDIPTDKPVLIIIHGTFSSFDGGFAGMGEATWKKLHEAYAGQVFAFDHRTITVSPVQNAIDLLKALPERVEADLLTHSRGGLVGDVLARCDSRLRSKIGYSEAEIDTIRAESADVDEAFKLQTGPAKMLEQVEAAAVRGVVQLGRQLLATRASLDTLAKEMVDVTDLAEKKKLKVRRIVRVACPAAGTTLLSERMDHWLNAILNLVKLGSASFPGVGRLVDLIRRLLLAVLSERSDAAIFPGIYAMVPGVGFCRINNDAGHKLPCELINVAGDSETSPDSALHSLATIVGNLYYLQPNDFVVDTASMSRGLHLRKRNRTLTIQNAAVSHFAYFAKPRHRDYIIRLLLQGELGDMARTGDISFTENFLDRTDYGKLVNKIVEPGELRVGVVSGQRPIVLLLPGIMGSNLSVDGRQKWFQVDELAGGALVADLAPDADVKAVSVAAEYYEGLTDHLHVQGYDAINFPYDWRLSMADEATRLKDYAEELMATGQPITVVAHSMGGLLFRQYMFDHRGEWVKLRDEHMARVILLGTPWRGSHLVTETLTGLGKRIKQLALLDMKNRKTTLLATLNRWPGLYELLPLDDTNLLDKDWWETKRGQVRHGTMPAIPEARLKAFGAFRKMVDKGLATITTEDWQRFYYVAGHDKDTVDGYDLVYRLFALRSVLSFTSTPRGDGSVTWARGIPQEIAPERLFYVGTEHAELPSDKRLFGGLIDLIRNGHTRAAGFAKIPPVGHRRGGPIEVVDKKLPSAVATGTPYEVVMGVSGRNRARDRALPAEINVSVFNGDLRWARFPVLVGHFAHDGIVSAERSIDDYLGGILSERHRFAFYPGAVGEQEVIYDPNQSPKGTIVVGLGDKDDLTNAALARTVEKGILKYLLFLRDNQVEDAVLETGGYGVSALFVGSIYGVMPLRESITAIIRGVRAANALVAAYNAEGGGATLFPVTEIQFVDYYEDRAYEAFKCINELVERGGMHGIRARADIEEGFRKRKRFLREGSRSWWQNLSTTHVTASSGTGEHLEFRTYTRGASFSREQVHGNLGQARFLADSLSTKAKWDERLAKVLFEMLIPNAYKDFIRNNRNLTWRMDLFTAAFPWELFHDSDYGSEPTFVRAGMVRQLLDEAAPLRPRLVRERRCLVVANPRFGKEYPALPGAEAEGNLVRTKLAGADYEVVEMIHAEPAETLLSVFAKGYKIMHFASHGVYDPAGAGVGIVIGEGQLIEPGTLRQLSAIPELVFVNCCYLGQIAPDQSTLREGRPHLAANIGAQLIRSGVKAVIVAGWAVDDAAAATFAETFYTELLAGEYFGESVRKARKACYEDFGNTNTWGAYQCYGDPFYRAELVGQETKEARPPGLQQEILLELDNLIYRAQSITGDVFAEKSALVAGTRTLLDHAAQLGRIDATMLEKEAEVYVYLGLYTEALDRYEQLFATPWGLYRVVSRVNYLAIAIDRVFNSGEKQSKIYKDIGAHIKAIESGYVADHPVLAKHSLAVAHKLAAAVGTKRQAIKESLLAANLYLDAALLLDVHSWLAVEHLSNYLALVAFHNALVGDGSKKWVTIESQLGVSVADYFARWEPGALAVPVDADSLHEIRLSLHFKLGQLAYVGLTAAATGSDPEIPLRHLAEEALAALRAQLAYSVSLRDLHRLNVHLRVLALFCEAVEADTTDLSEMVEMVRRGIPRVKETD